VDGWLAKGLTGVHIPDLYILAGAIYVYTSRQLLLLLRMPQKALSLAEIILLV